MDKVTWKDELPQEILPNDPSWRENVCFDGYDHERNVGFWIHCSRWQHDLTVWREQVLVYAPDGTYLVHRAWGRGDSTHGPAGPLLKLTCLEPGKAWSLRYRGPARRATREELECGKSLPEGPQLLLNLAIEFSTTAEMWDMSEGLRSPELGKSHMEQTGHFLGDISYEKTTVRMDGFGWHDHSKGPRHFGGMLRHCWIHGDLSKGRSFCLTVVENDTGKTRVRTVDRAVIWEGGRLFEASCPNPPFLDSAAVPGPQYTFTLNYQGGSITIDAEPLRCMPISCDESMEIVDGLAPDIAIQVTYEQGTIFTVDGTRFSRFG